jgi:hypothetical protein
MTVVTREDWQGENKTPKVKLLQQQVPFSARGTLPPGELPRIPMSQEPGSCGYNKRETKSIGYEYYRIMPSKETLRYCGKPIRIRKTPESRPRRSWQPK